MELSDLQSTYEYFRGRLSNEAQALLGNKYMYIESIMPWIYGDFINYQCFGEGEVASEIMSVFEKLGAIIKKKAKRSLYFKRMDIDKGSQEAMQTRYDELRGGLSKWSARMVEQCSMQSISSLAPWIEGRYVKFSCLHSPTTRIAKEMDDVVLKLQSVLSVLQREHMVKTVGSQTISLRTKKILLQNRLELILPELSSHARRVLADNGLASADALWPWVEGKKEKFSNLKGCGEATQDELQAMVRSLKGYIDELKYDSQRDEPTEPTTIVPEPQPTIEEEPRVVRELQEVDISEELHKTYAQLYGRLSVRASNVLRYNNINNADDFFEFMRSSNMDFNKLNKCGQKTSDELLAMANALCASKENSGLPLRKTGIGTYSVERLVFLQAGIDRWLYSKSNRTRRIFKAYNLDTIQALIPYLLEPDLKSPILRQSKTTQVRSDYDELMGILRTYLINLALCGKEKETPEEPVPLSMVYGFSEEDKAFARQFKAINKHWPMFFLLKKYFEYTVDSSELVFATTWGLNGGKMLSGDKAANVLGYTQEGVKQKIRSVVDSPSAVLRNFLVHQDWQQYTFGQNDYYVYDGGFKSDELSNVCSKEHLGDGAAMLPLLQFFGYEISFVDKESYALSHLANTDNCISFAVKKDYANYKFRLSIKEAAEMCRQQRNNHVKVDIKQRFVNDKRFWISSLQLNRHNLEVIVSLLSDCFSSLFEVEVKNGEMLLASNKVNYSEEIYWILKTAGVRLHIDDIITRLLEQYPDCPYTKPYQIKYYLRQDGRILNVGKSSYWELKEWGNLSGSIREVAINIADGAKKPLTVDELVQKVLEYRPDSNAHSVRAIIQQCIKAGELQYSSDY